MRSTLKMPKLGDAVDTVVSNAIIEPDVFDQAIADRQPAEASRTDDPPQRRTQVA